MHVYNNFYEIENVGNYGYSWGVGIESAISAENNFFKTDQAISPGQFIERFNGTSLHAAGTFVNAFSSSDGVEVVEALNDLNDPDLLTDLGWTPTLFERVYATRTVPFLVELFAGPFFWSLPWRGSSFPLFSAASPVTGPKGSGVPLVTDAPEPVLG